MAEFNPNGVLILLDTLTLCGAENLAANIAIKLAQTGIYNPVICATRTGGELEFKLRENNIKYLLLGRRNRYELHKFLSIKKIIHNENIKLIHAHNLGSSFWGGILGKLFGIPAVSHFHAHHKKLERNGDLIASKIINKLSDKIISISEFERKRLIDEEAISPSKIVTIYNGIKYQDYENTSNKEIRRQFGINDKTAVVAMVAAFRKQKNHKMFLHAASEVLKTHHDVIFLLVGDGTTREDIERTAVDLGISDNCIFTGVRQDIPDILSITDIGVLCSYWEGIPLVILEYMAAKRPVISTDVSGIREVIEDNKNGFLVPNEDYLALAQKIKLLLENKSLAESMGHKGLETVKEKFSEDTMMNSVEKLYNKVLSKNS